MQDGKGRIIEIACFMILIAISFNEIGSFLVYMECNLGTERFVH